MKKTKSLRFKLFFWYIVSLALLGFFIILTVHIYQYKYSAYVLGGLFLILSIIGFMTIYKITQSIGDLSSQIRQISSKNLDQRINSIKSDDEIGELAISFNDLLNRLDTAFKRERQFIGDVAHEMKTPITTLRSSFEVTLQKERTKEEYEEIIKESITETERITNTLKNILELAWSEAPNQSQKEIFNLSLLVEEVVEIAQKLAMKKKIQVNHLVLPNVKVKGFQDRLGRAILNLIDNAIKFTPVEGKVEINLEKESDQAIISVKDTGYGIEPFEIEHIFDRFYRGTKTDKIFGAGLGLAIAKSTVNIHQGVIKVVSHPGKGTVFFVFLPVYKKY